MNNGPKIQGHRERSFVKFKIRTLGKQKALYKIGEAQNFSKSQGHRFVKGDLNFGEVFEHLKI